MRFLLFPWSIKVPEQCPVIAARGSAAHVEEHTLSLFRYLGFDSG
jgi:hypothetical protein